MKREKISRGNLNQKSQSEHAGLRTWIEIDQKALEHNYKTLRSLMKPKTLFMAVVKSNAYGHSLVDTSKIFEKLGADWLGVDSIVEAMTLRREGIKKPIFVLGLTLPERLVDVIENDVSITVSTFETLQAIEKIDFPAKKNGDSSSEGGKKIKIHIKVDTGMHRQGFQLADMERVISKLEKLSDKIIVEGLFTHLASAKNPSFRELTQKQLDQFALWRKAFADANLGGMSGIGGGASDGKLIVHAGASGGAMIFPESHFDMVRFGISIYGLWPSREAMLFMSDKISLKPALTWKTIIGEIKNVKKGDKVGYDFTEEFFRDSKIAICPIGYWHGFPRSLSSIGHVLVGGKRARVVGRVSMDMITIDITDIPDVKIADEVVLIGKQGGEEVSAMEVADSADMSHYELVTCINPLIKKVVI